MSFLILNISDKKYVKIDLFTYSSYAARVTQNNFSNPCHFFFVSLLYRLELHCMLNVVVGDSTILFLLFGMHR